MPSSAPTATSSYGPTTSTRRRSLRSTLVDRAEVLSEEGKDAAAKAPLNALAIQLDGAQYDALRAALRALAES